MVCLALVVMAGTVVNQAESAPQPRRRVIRWRRVLRPSRKVYYYRSSRSGGRVYQPKKRYIRQGGQAKASTALIPVQQHGSSNNNLSGLVSKFGAMPLSNVASYALNMLLNFVNKSMSFSSIACLIRL
jgi:hypothetical protein